MSREPRPHRPAVGDQPSSHVVGDPPQVEPYPLRRGGRAVPDRTRTPDIGPACEYTGAQSRPGKRFASNEENRRGPEIGSREDAKTRQEYGHGMTEARGQRTRTPESRVAS